MSRRFILPSMLLLTLGLMAGCGKPPAPAPVRGKVSFRGSPIPTGTIVFIPDATRGNQGDLSIGTIQPDGSYLLAGTGSTKGVVPGWHVVTIVSVVDGPASPGQPFTPPRSLLPDKYRDPQLSGLSCEVKSGQDNVFNFNLE